MSHDREQYKVQLCAPECSSELPEEPVCAIFEKCRGCPYPRTDLFAGAEMEAVFGLKLKG